MNYQMTVNELRNQIDYYQTDNLPFQECTSYQIELEYTLPKTTYERKRSGGIYQQRSP